MSKPSLRWVVDRNPFYLLSACCGLLGCWLLGNVSQPNLLDTAMKVAALLVYEVAVVALAVWLAKQDQTVRDAAILSVLALTLTADAAFFSTETAMLKPAAAAGFAALGAAQALAIVGALFHGIAVRLPPRGGWLLGLDIVTVHVLPVMLRFGALGSDHAEWVFWPAFVGIGALLAAHAWPDPWRGESRTAISIFLASILTHAFAALWVFDADFFPVFLSPPLMGLAFLALRRESSRGVYALSIAAVLLAAMPPPPSLVLAYGPSDWLALSPLRIVLVWAAAAVCGVWRIERSRAGLLLSMGLLLLAVLGHTPQAMRGHVVALAMSFRTALSAGVPSTRAGWGAMLFALAFLLLGFGAWTSWRRLHEVRGDV